ncbi:MAG: hypothetical protein ACYS99_06960, partial [Planctomycetota bacterium]
LVIEEREAAAFDEEAVKRHLAAQRAPLRQWPIKLALLSPLAPFLKNADLVLSADCAAFAHASFHEDLLDGRPLAIACPKLDDPDRNVNQLAAILEAASIKSITILKMEVPCCGGLDMYAQMACERAGVDIPITSEVVEIGPAFQLMRRPACPPAAAPRRCELGRDASARVLCPDPADALRDLIDPERPADSCEHSFATGLCWLVRVGGEDDPLQSRSRVAQEGPRDSPHASGTELPVDDHELRPEGLDEPRESVLGLRELELQLRRRRLTSQPGEEPRVIAEHEHMSHPALHETKVVAVLTAGLAVPQGVLGRLPQPC